MKDIGKCYLDILRLDPYINLSLFSGADLASLIRESAVASLRSRFFKPNGILDTKSSAEAIFVEMEHFDTAFTKVSPSVLPHDKKSYDKLRAKFG